MKKTIALMIMLIIVVVVALKMFEIGNKMVDDANLKDLQTNMLLIQANLNKCVEEVNFQKANVKDEARILEIKNENLKGKKLTSNEEVKKLAEATNKIDIESIEEYYYLDEQDLADIGLEEVSIQKNGYFVIRYYIDEISVEVINTKGYDGLYTLEDLNKNIEE